MFEHLTIQEKTELHDRMARAQSALGRYNNHIAATATTSEFNRYRQAEVEMIEIQNDLNRATGL